MIVVFSASSNASQQVQREIERAVSKGLPIVPFRIEDVKPSKSMEYFLSAPHWLDALTKPLEAHIVRLAQVVQAILNPEKVQSKGSPNRIRTGGRPVHTQRDASSPVSYAETLPPTRNVFNHWLPFGLKKGVLLFVALVVFLLILPVIFWPKPNVLSDQYAQYRWNLDTGRGSIFFLRSNAPISFSNWLSLAENQNSIAQLFVGRCYQEGVFVERDYEVANQWLNRSADLGNEVALAVLGYSYDAGLGVDADPIKAMQIYQDAYKKGVPFAAHNIAWLYRTGFGGKPDFSKAIEWFTKGAELGHTPSMISLGDMYRFGTGVAIDLETSEQWYEQAFNAKNASLVGNKLGNRFAVEFKEYLSENATSLVKTESIDAISELQVEYQLQDFPTIAGMFSLSDFNIAMTGLDDLGDDDPLKIAHTELILKYIGLFSEASRSERRDNLSGFSMATEKQLGKWYAAASYAEINSFWNNCYRDLDFSDLENTADWSSFIKQQDWVTRSLMLSGKRKEASENIASVIEFCDRILRETPWDWYLKVAYTDFCFEMAAIWAQLGEPSSAQPLLKRAWNVILLRYGKEQLLSKYDPLPLKGNVPSGASDADREFFARFAEQDDDEKKSSLIKRFTVPVNFAGKMFNFYFYVFTGPRGYAELQDQFRWIEERRGGEVPNEVQASFRRLNAIANENNVDFGELCVYALANADTSTNEKENAASSKRDDDPFGSD